MEFGGDEGETIEAAGGVGEGDSLGEAEAEDGGLGWEFVFGVGELGGEDVGDGEALDEVLLAVVEGGDRNVVGGEIGDEDQVFDFIFAQFGLEFCGEEALVEGFSGGLDGVEVVGCLEGGAELADQLVELGFAEGTFGLAEDSAFGGPEDAGFVFEDEGIDQDGVGLGGDDAFGAGDEGFGAFVDRGAALLVFFGGDGFDEGVVGGGELAALFAIAIEVGAASLLALGELFTEGDEGVVFFDNFFFDGTEGDLSDRGCRSRTFGDVVNFLNFQEFENLLCFTDTALF
ncbi:MAG: hypothetical protein RLZZ511_4008 [Cyanobacteriota bacterium]